MNNEPTKSSITPTEEQAAQTPSRTTHQGRPWIIGFGVIGLLALGGMIWWSATNLHYSTKTKALEKVSVRLNWLNQAQFAGLYVAAEKGFYRNENLDVAINEYADGVDGNQEVANGTSTFAISTPLEVFASRDIGNKVKAVAAIYQTSPWAVLAGGDSGIKEPADFKGKTLGNVGNNFTAKVGYKALLAYAGLKDEQATVKSVGFDTVKEITSKASDTVDIYRTQDTYLFEQAKVPYNLILPEHYGFTIYGDVLVASDDAIAKKPDQIARFVRASLKGWEYALAHQEETLVIVAKYQNAAYNDAAYEKHIFNTTVPFVKPTGGQPIGSMQFIPWSRAYQGIKAAGLLKTNLDASSGYTTQFVR
jgi:NitT/TauT family transport system substrate-binding protein